MFERFPQMLLDHAGRDAELEGYRRRRHLVKPPHYENLSAARRQLTKGRIESPPQIDIAFFILLFGSRHRLVGVSCSLEILQPAMMIGDKVGGDTKEIGLRLINLPRLARLDQPSASFLDEILYVVGVRDATRHKCM